jgi:hypothetical protein
MMNDLPFLFLHVVGMITTGVLKIGYRIIFHAKKHEEQSCKAILASYFHLCGFA